MILITLKELHFIHMDSRAAKEVKGFKSECFHSVKFVNGDFYSVCLYVSRSSERI